MRWLTQADKDIVRPLIEQNVDKTDAGHWLWLGQLDTSGYGLLFSTAAYRLSYMAWIGPIGRGMHIDHVCRTRACVRPHREHLEQVTRAENNRRAMEYVQKYPGEQVHHAAQRWCKYGHKLDEENTGYEKDGHRFCKPCRREAARKARRKYQAPRGEQWHVDAEVFASLADHYPPVPGEPVLTNREIEDLIGLTTTAFEQWRRRNPDLCPPHKGPWARWEWPQSHVLRLIAAKSDENWAKPRKDGDVLGRAVWVVDPETGQKRLSRKVADVRAQQETSQPVA